jgi:apolipoprotein D and lipocalin family protein
MEVFMRYLIIAVCCVLAAFCLSACRNSHRMSTLEVVPRVELERYLGTWYEIARYPNRFQKDCFVTTATYDVRDDGKISVVNRCRAGSADGPEKVARGRAWVVDHDTNARLKVQFFWPFSGDYWIIQLGEEYEYAVVGHPERTYLWILSRTPQMDPALFESICKQLRQQGYDPSRLIGAGVS